MQGSHKVVWQVATVQKQFRNSSDVSLCDYYLSLLNSQ